MAANQDIFDDFIRHQVRLQRLTNGQASRMLSSLDGSNESLAEALYTAIVKIQSTTDLTKGRSALYESLYKKIYGLRSKAINQSLDMYLLELKELIEFEAEYITGIHEKNVPLVLSYSQPSKRYMSAILTDGLFYGKSITEYFSQFTDNDTARILAEVKNGISRGTPTERIIRSVMGSKNMGYKNGVMGKSRNSVRSMVRTITSGVTNQVRGLWNLANSDIIAYEIYSAILDGRTTYDCARLDGKKFDIGVGPHPPLHFNCRSLRIGIVDVLAKEGLIGDRPYVRDTRTARQRRIDFRKKAKAKAGVDNWRAASLEQRRKWINTVKVDWQAANVGKTKGYSTFGEWFDGQPSSFQKEYLGASRYKAFSNGTTLSDFVRPNGTNWTIEELKSRDVL